MQEGYDANAAKAAGVSKYSNYDRDGGVMSNELVVTGEAKPITIRFEGSGNSLIKGYLLPLVFETYRGLLLIL